MHRKIFYFIVFVVASVLIYTISSYTISINAVPPLSSYVATTTLDTVVSTTNKLIATSTAAEIQMMKVKAPKKTINVAIASTSEALALGLSGRPFMDSEYGMLFFLQKPSKPPFWMKDMEFPLDIIWINSSKKVIGIARNVQPDSYPEIFTPPSPVSYVLEINAGLSKDFGIATGTRLVF